MKWLDSYGYISCGTIALMLGAYAVIFHPDWLHPRLIFGAVVAVGMLVRGICNLKKIKGESNNG